MTLITAGNREELFETQAQLEACLLQLSACYRQWLFGLQAYGAIITAQRQALEQGNVTALDNLEKKAVKLQSEINSICRQLQELQQQTSTGLGLAVFNLDVLAEKISDHPGLGALLALAKMVETELAQLISLNNENQKKAHQVLAALEGEMKKAQQFKNTLHAYKFKRVAGPLLLDDHI